MHSAWILLYQNARTKVFWKLLTTVISLRFQFTVLGSIDCGPMEAEHHAVGS
jgi:hypothetical protein